MNILAPITITDTMLSAGTTVAEPAAGETTWVSGAAHTAGDKRIRATTHRAYLCKLTHTGRAALPEADPDYWLDIGPTQRWAPFDSYTNTAATAATSLAYVLQPGFFNAIAFYGLLGSTLTVAVKDAPGGAVIYSNSVALYEPPSVGLYEYLFTPAKVVDKLILTGLPIRPLAELTVTVTGTPCALGMLVVGDYVSLLGAGQWGGTHYGASAEPISNSYIKANADGTTSIVRRASATGMRATVMLPRDQADQALLMLQSVLDVPVAWVATSAPGYDGLNVFGLGSASVSYDGFAHASLNINVKGFI